jgi:hypothetical protein
VIVRSLCHDGSSGQKKDGETRPEHIPSVL